MLYYQANVNGRWRKVDATMYRQYASVKEALRALSKEFPRFEWEIR